MRNKKEEDLKLKKQKINEAHIAFYDKTLEILEFILSEFSKELTRADVEFLEFSKTSITVVDFLISSIVKVQKGHRLALGLDETEFEDTSPQINIIEGLSKEKI